MSNLSFSDRPGNVYAGAMFMSFFDIAKTFGREGVIEKKTAAPKLKFNSDGYLQISNLKSNLSRLTNRIIEHYVPKNKWLFNSNGTAQQHFKVKFGSIKRNNYDAKLHRIDANSILRAIKRSFNYEYEAIIKYSDAAINQAPTIDADIFYKIPSGPISTYLLSCIMNDSYGHRLCNDETISQIVAKYDFFYVSTTFESAFKEAISEAWLSSSTCMLTGISDLVISSVSSRKSNIEAKRAYINSGNDFNLNHFLKRVIEHKYDVDYERLDIGFPSSTSIARTHISGIGSYDVHRYFDIYNVDHAGKVLFFNIRNYINLLSSTQRSIMLIPKTMVSVNENGKTVIDFMNYFELKANGVFRFSDKCIEGEKFKIAVENLKQTFTETIND